MKHRFQVESVFGWVKSVGGLRQAKVCGMAKVNVEFNLPIITRNILMTARSMQCKA
jgi:Transposase DDE domain